MAPAKRPENFVSYRAAGLGVRAVATAIDEVDAALVVAVRAPEKADLTTRRRLLELQARLLEGDACFDRRQYRQALDSYQDVARLVLGLLDPDAKKRPSPSVIIDTPRVRAALQELSAGLLGNLIPEARVARLVAPGQPLSITPAEAGTPYYTQLGVQETAVADVLALTDQAGAAAGQGRWDRAEAGYAAALAKVTGATPADNRIKADILLNLGAVKVQRGDTAGALPQLQEARELFRTLGNKLGEAQAAHNTGVAQVRANNRTEAVNNLAQARTLAGQVNLRSVLENAPAQASAPPTSPASPTRPSSPSLAATPSTLAINLRPRVTSNIATAISRKVAIDPRLVALPTDGVASSAERLDSDLTASQLGTGDLQLMFRNVRDGSGSTMELLETPTQKDQLAFTRQLTIAAGDAVRTLTWAGNAGPTVAVLAANVYAPHRVAKDPKKVGFRITDVADLAARLPQLYHVVLPIKLGDCYHYLGEFETAEAQYQRAAAANSLLNVALEAPDLWRRLVRNALVWGDSLYREDQAALAMPIYARVVTDQDVAPDSVLYTLATLAPTGVTVKTWLAAVKANTPLPDLNPAILELLQQIRQRWQFIRAGLDFYGSPANIVPPFTFKYLQDVARYMANQAILVEQRYIDFLDRYENEQLTREQLEQAQELASREVDAAKAREQEAEAMLDAAQAATTLANLRATNAQNTLNLFNSTAYEAARLAGLIARGNAWTGDDLPNLDYSAGGVTYDDEKHKVLQRMTQRQTEISQQLQRAQMQSAVAELNAARAIATAQQQAARARLDGAKIQTDIAELRDQHAGEMLDSFNSQFFDPEQWLNMAAFMSSLVSTALHRAIEAARLMQRAYNFENMETVSVIRRTYHPASTNGLLGGVKLLSDIDGFTYRQITSVRFKPVPIKWPVSLAERYPGQFELQFKATGRIELETFVEDIALTFPGTYRQQLSGVEVEFDGFIPPEGLHGRLTNAGLSRYRDIDGNVQTRLQPAETLVLSRFARRQDGIMITARPEMRGLFEGAGAASGWTLEIPASANDVDLRHIFDVRLVLYFEALFDQRLFAQDSKPPQALQLRRSRALHLRFAMPDAFYAIRETGKATLNLDARDFPFNHRQPVLTGLALVAVPAMGKNPAGTKLSLQYPGATTPVAVTFGADNSVRRASLPVAGVPSAFGSYIVTLDPTNLARKDDLADLILVADYQFTPPA